MAVAVFLAAVVIMMLLETVMFFNGWQLVHIKQLIKITFGFAQSISKVITYVTTTHYHRDIRKKRTDTGSKRRQGVHA